MPFYEFRCRDCGSRFTTRNIPWAEKGAVRCPVCGGASLQEIYGAAVLVRRARATVPACAEAGCAAAEEGGCAGGCSMP